MMASMQEKKALLIEDIKKMVDQKMVPPAEFPKIEEAINDYFGKLTGDVVDPVELAKLISERLSTVKTMDAGALIAVGIIIGVAIRSRF